MNLKKITDTDLQGYGVVGMEDTPNLSARQMQEKVEEVVRKVVIPVINSNVDATASKQDLMDAVFNAGAGDMQASAYDGNMDGIVNRADNGFFTYSHTKTGNVHQLYGNGSNIKFVSSAPYVQGDVFMIGDIVYPAFLINGDSLPDGYFARDMAVSCFVHGNCLNFISGGAGLNVSIKGGTQPPASPAENTVWVNTDIAVTGWVISKDQPEEVPMGTVWVKSDTTGNACINIARKNRVYVTLSCCKQWTGSGFETRQASVYIDGQWQELLKVPLYIYNEGSSDTAISQYSTNNVYKNTETVYSEVTSWWLVTGEVSNVTASIRTAEMVELTGYKTVKALVYAKKGYGDADAGTPNISLFVTDAETQNLNTSNSAYNTVIASTIVNSTLAAWSEIELDITNISGMHYVGIGLGNKSSAASQLYVRALWLE